MEDKTSRKSRKEAARQAKRKRIEEAGGVRPRRHGGGSNGTHRKHTDGADHNIHDNDILGGKDREKIVQIHGDHSAKDRDTRKTVDQEVKGERSASEQAERETLSPAGRNVDGKEHGDGRGSEHLSRRRHQQRHNNGKQRHRFGRVMEKVPCPHRPRRSTLSIAVPGSIVSNCQTRELRTHLVGQIARAAAIYHVDEIVVFDDNLADRSPHRGGGGYHNRRPRHREAAEGKGNESKDTEGGEKDNAQEKVREDDEGRRPYVQSDPHTFMARILQYCECPQYLRRHFFPMHPDLQFAGLLSPLDAPHHVRAGERSKYREGVVLDQPPGPNGGSYVNVGIRGAPAEIDRVVTPGVRCTVKVGNGTPDTYDEKHIRGTVVSPAAPREEDGTYWGYTVRLADSINAVFEECPFDGGYDLKVGTSERGDVTVDDRKFALPKFKHLLIVFGGVAGIEECIDADESLPLSGSESRCLFNLWVNTCPFQGSRTIRTEEAVLLSLARMRPHIAKNSEKPGNVGPAPKKKERVPVPVDVKFSDGEPSEESSDDE